MSKNYGDDSIGVLIGAERIRRRPASVLGSSGLAGARHGFYEMYGNAIDEKTAGYGKLLIVRYHADGSVSIRDYGRGVPLGWNDKPDVKNWNWHVIYNELYGGGKYDTNQEELSKIVDWSKFNPLDYNYLFSVGLNGLGAASTQYTSEFFEVRSYRDGVCKSRSFSRGIPLVNGEPFNMFSATQEEIEALEEEVSDTNEPNGTYVHWKPDDTVFDDINIGADWLLDTCRDISAVAGIELHFIDDMSGTESVFEAGTLKDIVRMHCEGKLLADENGVPYLFSCDAFNHGTTKVEGKNFIWVCMCEVAFGLTTEEVPHSCYHNSVRMISGIQYEAIQDAITSFMMEKGKKQGVRIDRRDYMGIFNVAVSTYSNYASFRNQTKDAVDDSFIYNIIKTALLNKLQVEYGKGNKVIVDAVERVIEEANSRVAAQELNELTRKVAKMKREKAPEKFITCDAYEAKRYSEVELWITEGDSAKGSVKAARNKIFQAIYPIRGKGLNVLKASNKRILENKEIRELFAILGTGFDLNHKGTKFFNMEDLRVGKIIFATDADEDGYQIRMLLFLIFYKLAPELLRAGKIFIAETPRFGLELIDGSRIYARNDADRDRLRAEYGARVTKISRYKGLGEVDADILRETTVHPDTRMLVPVTCNFDSQFERDLIDALFGADKYNQRKTIISAILGADVTEMLEDNALMIDSIDESDMDDEVDYEEVVV